MLSIKIDSKMKEALEELAEKEFSPVSTVVKKAIDKYLQGDKDRVQIVDEKTSMPEDTGLALDEETDQEMPRIRIELEEVEERVSDFREVEKGFSGQEAIRESKRCLRCDLERERMSI